MKKTDFLKKPECLDLSKSGFWLPQEYLWNCSIPLSWNKSNNYTFLFETCVPGPLGTLLHETLLVPPAHLIIRFAYLYILLLQQLATTGLLIPRIGKNFLFKVCNIRSKNALTNMQVSIINWATIVDDKTCNKVI